MSAHKILRIDSSPSHLQEELCSKLKISKMLAQVLINRKINTLKEADKFLNVRMQDLLDPFGFSDMHKAVGLLKNAVKAKQKVMVFSDYDVDGITSLALIKSALLRLGITAEHYLPHRVKEGYGLVKDIAHIARHKGIKLLITADCGTNSHRQIQELRDSGIDVIITDHHELSNQQLPPATCIINPKIKGSGYGFRDLAGVGVAYKFCQAFTGLSLQDDLDLVALGTIADVVPLVNENRIFARFGLANLSNTRRQGIRSLIKASRLKDRNINSTFVSFILAPRINASGRMDSAETSLGLLMSQDQEEADKYALAIEAYNRQRQKIESDILDEALALIDKEVNFKQHKVIVVAGQDWHTGVLGIVASKIADKFYRPTILISKGAQTSKGSGRSIKNFHLFHALLECSDFLDTFGGHSHAVGLAIDNNKIIDFRNKINLLADKKLKLEDLLPSLDIDMELKFTEIDPESVSELERLEPFGSGNPEPLFYTKGLRLKGDPQVLSRDTLKFWASDGAIVYPVIGFGMARLKDSLINAGSINLAYHLRIDKWHGDNAVILEAKEIFFL